MTCKYIIMKYSECSKLVKIIDFLWPGVLVEKVVTISFRCLLLIHTILWEIGAEEYGLLLLMLSNHPTNEYAGNHLG